MGNDNKIIQQVNQSANAMRMLNASCQGIVEAYIHPTQSSWYDVLENELVNAQRLVRGWRINGSLYFDQYILDTSIACGQNFTNNKETILQYFDALIAGSEGVKQKLLLLLQQLEGPVNQLNAQINEYENNLKDFAMKMQGARDAMAASVNEIQAQESSYQSQINALNAKIAALQQQIQADRDAIARAKSEEKKAIVETIFGIIFAPVTGGLSLILAGIGVGSIAEAESQISSMGVSINDYQDKIQRDLATINDDARQIAVLQGLIMPVVTAIQDADLISTALDGLKVLWQLQADELVDLMNKINRAENAEEYVVGKAWFIAACAQWEAIHINSQAIKDAPLRVVHITVP
jgi:outer membrane murein-binding lipoprotein Lpp